jgi:uncharacterized membrane protein HdeD (DUF308 family)
MAFGSAFQNHQSWSIFVGVSNARWVTTMVLGAIMFAIGLFVALRPLWSRNAVFLGARWLDLTFALVFMLRGVINIRTARGRRQRALAQG